MRESLFGFIEPPFSNTPDPKFFFPTETHQRALETLLRGIVDNKGFLLLTGDVGTGKTTLCRTLLRELDGKVDTALVLNPDLSEDEILKVILRDFGLPSTGSSKFDLMELLYEFLLERARMGRNTLIVIDDAQNLPQRSMEQVRMISNFETEKKKLVQILLVGQPEMVTRLEQPALRQFRQRIAVHTSLRRLSRSETVKYIAHRVKVAGNCGRASLFTIRALRAIYKATRGYPRSVNTLCDHLLTAATRRGLRVIDGGMVRETIHVTGLRRPGRRRLAGILKEFRWAAAFAGVVLFVGISASLAVRQDSHDRAAGRMSQAVLDVRLAKMESSLASLKELVGARGGAEGSAEGTYTPDDLEGKLSAARAESEDLRRELMSREEELRDLYRDLGSADGAQNGSGASPGPEALPASVQQREAELKKRIRELQSDSRSKAEDVRKLERELEGIRRELRETVEEKEQLAKDLVKSRKLVSSAVERGPDGEQSLIIEELKTENAELRRSKQLVVNIAARTIKSQGHEIERLTKEREALLKKHEVEAAKKIRGADGETSMISYPPEEQ